VLEAVGTAAWTGVPLRAVLEEAGVLGGAAEVLFTGLDRGVQDGDQHDYERSLPLDEALRDEVILAHTMNGQPLPPQHGFPLRLIVPGWYGMAHVKWLTRITVLDQAFRGFEQEVYRIKQSEEDEGTPLTRMLVRSLMVPPGIPDFLTRTRYLAPGRHVLEGRAWSGYGSIQSVDLSPDGGRTWHPARLGRSASPFAWRSWSYGWTAEPGAYELCCRAGDSAGYAQPIGQSWNYRGVANNMIQRVRVIVS
jgi:DMSO/TMAO reductase YedYZ molybdopterin-dependent catalytic subunit